MLNRRHIRVKVMQAIYAFKGGEGDDFSRDQKFLLHSIDNMYNLYLLLISIFIEIQKKSEVQLEKIQQKHLATDEDKNPNAKFANNALLLMLKENDLLMEKMQDHKIDNWDLDSEYIDILFKAITSSNAYAEYMQTRDTNFKEDKAFIVAIFKDIIAPNDKLYDYLEDKNLTWLDDLPTINTTILKLFQKAKSSASETHFLPKLYKDDDDRQFAIDLLKKTILNQNFINEEIKNKTLNWDADRIASVDYVLIQMAISEFQYFPSIPVKVTINEYLELAKEYSTPKSSVFINGILDKLVKEYEADGKLNKVGRGLM